MKSYEEQLRFPKGAVVIRVDGKAFHTWTKKVGCERPFDERLTTAMQRAAYFTSQEMQGFKLAYTQSDECTFLLANTEEMSEPWFGYKPNKLISITASMFTYFFNREFNNKLPAFFDARAFSIPIEDAANSFVWRQQDNKRNYIQAYALSNFSKKEVHGKSCKELTEQLEKNKLSVEDLPEWVRFGTFVVNKSDGTRFFLRKPLDYYIINELIGFRESIDDSGES